MDLPESNPFAPRATCCLRVPPFDRIRTEHFAPAFAAGVQATATNSTRCSRASCRPPSSSTRGVLRPLSRTGEAVFFNLVGTDATTTCAPVQAEWGPRLAAHHDAVRLDPRLVERVRVLHEDPPAGLGEEQRRLLERCTATRPAPARSWTRRASPGCGS